MNDLLALLLALRDAAHIAHLRTTGPSFFADHEFLAEVYLAHDTAYDGIAERAIGLETKPDLFQVHADAAALLATMKDRTDYFACLLEGEQKLCAEILSASTDASIGTLNLLSAIADQSEVRQFKMKARLAT